MSPDAILIIFVLGFHNGLEQGIWAISNPNTGYASVEHCQASIAERVADAQREGRWRLQQELGAMVDVELVGAGCFTPEAGEQMLKTWPVTIKETLCDRP